MNIPKKSNLYGCQSTPKKSKSESTPKKPRKSRSPAKHKKSETVKSPQVLDIRSGSLSLVSDNGSGLVSAEFQAFFENNGIKHITSTPYHPATNGMAKQIVKRRLMIIQGSIHSRLARTLFSYRLTPQTMTGISPRELLLGRHPRSRLDLLKSHMVERVERNQLKQKEQHYSMSRERKLNVGATNFVMLNIIMVITSYIS